MEEREYLDVKADLYTFLGCMRGHIYELDLCGILCMFVCLCVYMP